MTSDGGSLTGPGGTGSAVPRVMCVHAHPDDESLWTGGTIARHVQRGGDLAVVTCTWAAGTPRHTELLDALTALGARPEPAMLGYADDRVPESAPDGVRFCGASFDDEVSDLVGHIRGFRPDVVITYDAFGIYGHPDHVRANRVACAAADAAAIPALYPDLGPAWQVRSLYFSTIPEWMIDDIKDDLFPHVPREFLPGTPPETIDLELDVSEWVSLKTDAIASHRSEVTRSRTIGALMALPPDKLARLLGTESYVRRDLVPGGADL